MDFLQGFGGLILVLLAVLNGWIVHRAGWSGWLLILLAGVEALGATVLVPPMVWQRLFFTWVILWLMSAMTAAWFRKRSGGES
ncbi:MAG: hypothetical protein ACM3ZA_02790 [Bacillota bacterium]